MPASPLAILGLGFVLGLRHALDVDHLAAVSTIVSERRNAWASALVGAVWGLGHTASLLAVGVLVIAFHQEIPASLARGLEFGVALMLIGLGARLLWTLARGGRVHIHGHVHGGRLHAHPHLHAAHPELGDHRHGPVGRRPFVVGMVHGLAGSAALMLVVLATIPQPAVAVAYVVVFGVGSVGGMTAMSTLIGLPFHLVSDRFERADRALRACAAVTSVVVGVMLAWEIGVASGMLL